ncbi:MAG: oligosaccharide flippase family protein [Lachnospiraceae bacterium]|nr:oligosaccharide flippase family protein [Lachnospiraceae bacterium]
MNKYSTKEIKYGALLSYLLLAINAVYGLFMTPFILKYINVEIYGVFTSVSSISGSLAVIDFGLGTTMTRYIAKYNATGEKNKANNFIAMAFVQFALVITLLTIIGIAFYININAIYSKTFNESELTLAKTIFVILILNMGMKLFENLLFGITNGNERFIFSNSIKVVSIFAKIMLVLVVLPITKNVLVVVLAETAVVIMAIIIFVVYIKDKLHIHPKLIEWDRRLFKESFIYTALMFIQNIVVQFSSNVDNILIGAKISAVAVTVYSMSLMIYSMYQSMSGAIANLMLPRITKRVLEGASSEKLQEEVEAFGRYQYFLLAAALGGLICVGKEFFSTWLGKNFEDCYLLSIILVTSVTLPTLGNVALSILRAQNKMIFRTFTVSFSCIANIIVTIIGINVWGYWGAAIGTAFASIINFIFMNAYYHVKLGFKIAKMLYNIAFLTTVCAAIPTAVVCYIKRFFCSGIVGFVLSAMVFLLIYIMLLFLFGMNKNEKKTVFGRIIKQV